MIDEIPNILNRTPAGYELIVNVIKVGAKTKCHFISMPDEKDEWLEAGGDPEQGANRTDTEIEDDDFPIPENYKGEIPEFVHTFFDQSQARLYCRMSDRKTVSEVRVVLPDDVPFRASMKGLVMERSISFNINKEPVSQVLMLYALKTGRRDDVLRALRALPRSMSEFGNDGKSVIFDKIADSPELFVTVAGKLLVASAKMQGGLATWALWEKTADGAVEFTRNLEKIRKGEAQPDYNWRFVQAVKEVAVDFRGLPPQSQVEKRWRKLGGRGEWRQIRNTLGFQWLPSLQDWRKSWETGLVSRGGC